MKLVDRFLIPYRESEQISFIGESTNIITYTAQRKRPIQESNRFTILKYEIKACDIKMQSKTKPGLYSLV